MLKHKTGRGGQTNSMKSGLARFAAATAVAVSVVGISMSAAQAADYNDYNAVVSKWSGAAQKAVKGIMKIHGGPYYATPTMLVWHETGPWKRIIATNTTTPHHFPMPHPDSVEQFVSYKVPVDKHDDIARFDGSVNIDRTRGEMSARCDAERHNILALNLAHDIIIGKRSVEGARAFYTRAVKIEMQKKQLHHYMLRLNFTPHKNANDTDKIAPIMRPLVREMRVKGKM